MPNRYTKDPLWLQRRMLRAKNMKRFADERAAMMAAHMPSIEEDKRPTWVYARQEIDGHPAIKVGITCNMYLRSASAQTDNPRLLKVIKALRFKTRAEASLVEATLHKKWAHVRVRGEWFGPEILSDPIFFGA